MNDIIAIIKDFGQKHKKPLIIAGIGGGFILAFIAGEKFDNLCVAHGFEKFDALGLIDWKIRDENGELKVVDISEFNEYLNSHSDAIRRIKITRF